MLRWKSSLKPADSGGGGGSYTLEETFADDSANEYNWSKAASTTYVGTLVAPASSYTATRLEFYLKKTGTGGGTITAEIWSATGSAGSETPNALLATSTTTVAASGVSATKGFVAFDFAGQAIASGTKYFFVMKTPSTGDGSNYYNLTLGSSYNTTNFETVKADATPTWSVGNGGRGGYCRSYSGGGGGSTAITLEGSAENEGFTGYNSPYDFSVSYPAVSTNDIMLAILTTERRTDFDGTPPTGWTKVIETDGDNTFNPTQAVYWKRATGSASATSETWNGIVNSSQQYYTWVGAYSGCVTSGSPIDASAGSYQAYGTSWSQSITTQTDNAMILAVAGSDSNARTFVWSDGTELVDKIYQSTASVSINEKIESTAGATTRAGTISAGQSGTMTAVALRDTAPTPLQTRTVSFSATDANVFTIDSDSGEKIWTDQKLNQAAVSNGLRLWNGSEAGNSGATYNSGNYRWSFSSASDCTTWWDNYWMRVKQDPDTGTYSDWINLTDSDGLIYTSCQPDYNNIGSSVTHYSGPGTWTTHAAGFKYQVEIYSVSNRP